MGLFPKHTDIALSKGKEETNSSKEGWLGGINMFFSPQWPVASCNSFGICMLKRMQVEQQEAPILKVATGKRKAVP